MTKKDAALHLLGIALAMNGAMGGDEGVDVWTTSLLWIAADLDPGIVAHRRYIDAVADSDAVETKLRRLIEHPGTPTGEREAAVSALDRVRRRRTHTHAA